MRPQTPPRPSATPRPEPARPSPAAYAAPAPVTLESAAADGDPVARYVLGMRELESGDVETAVALLRRAAEQGVPAAQYRYGKLLETGEGVAEDAAAALRWTERGRPSRPSPARCTISA